ncbi:MAG TPA: hypothetical protein VFO03_12175 [Gaiellaceae bacterium]|nr:hypothetical protein [Gaiellaceae bacterium]
MGTILGLIGMVFFVAGVIGLAAGVTWTIIKISPTRRTSKDNAEKPKPAS